MGPAGKEYVYKDELRAARPGRQAQKARQIGEAEVAEWLKAEEAKFNQRYERELMNPREALSLGSISEIVMPTDLRSALGKQSRVLPAPLQARPDAGRPAGVLLMSAELKPYNAYTNNPLIHRDRRLGKTRLRVGALASPATT